MSYARFPSLAHWGAYSALVENGRVVRCEPFGRDTAPSHMLAAIPAMVHSPLRIARPAIREGWREGKERSGSDRFREVPWDEALAIVAEELLRVRQTFGSTAILGGSYGWSSAGRVHHARSLLRRFLFLGGGCVDQVANYSFGAAQYILPRVIGTFAPVVGEVTDWPSIIKHARLLIAFGGLALKNAQVTSGGAGVHSLELWLRRAKASGIEFVSVSPLKSDAPDFLEAQWIPIRPNTDTALMLALAHTLIVEERYDAQFVSRYCVGFDKFRRYLLGLDDGAVKDAEWASKITGIPEETICELARRAATLPAMITCAWSLQRAHHGEQPYWAAIVLAAMLGSIGLPGTGFAFGHGSTNGIGVPRIDVAGPEVPLPLNPARSMIPVARIAECCSPPAPPTPSMAVDTPTLTSNWSTGRAATLPPSSGPQSAAARLAETADGDSSRQLVDGDGASCRHRAAGDHAARTQRRRRLLARFLRSRHAPRHRPRRRGPKRPRHFPRIWRTASVTRTNSPSGATRWAGANGSMIACAQARRQRELRCPVSSNSGPKGSSSCRPPRATMCCSRISVAIRALSAQDSVRAHRDRLGCGRRLDYADCPPHPAWLPPAEWLGSPAAAHWPLHLVTHQPATRLHSQMDPGPISRSQKVAGREPIRINPSDAAKRDIHDGDVVRVLNSRGACLAGAMVDFDVMPGVVVMATGAWFDPGGGSDEPERHGNPNVLTLDIGTSSLAQGTSALTALVEIERWNAPAPAVRAFSPPELVVG